MTNQKFLGQTVKAFWQGVNWENRPILTNQSSSSAMTLTVQDYFAMIPWSGGAIAVATSKPQIPQDLGSSETLEDFLDDISKFF
ncbi:hypothetical protein Syn7502_02683 [Synechococcus sp. PCC 7502]|uniref:hypothetical protein n=1 Tax=Synechococcus sp. PCC 7502 TaxID=1173263 RepID=UPI00029FA793|nr:hypothetical protein [Synechococcus sp. PCC 7502]AFY74636.1 hypothetical protein Syn7502_02683 [Synechococcus sp. PCC 7502]